MENTGYSLSDIAAATGNEGGFGGNWVLILLFAMIFGFGGNGFGRGFGDYGNFATAASQQDILFGQKFSDLDNKMDRLGNGIADATFALKDSVTGEGRALQMQLAQVNANIDNKFAALEKSQLEQTIDGLRQQISALNLNQAMCGVVRYPTSSAYAYSLPAANCGCSPCNGNV